MHISTCARASTTRTEPTNEPKAAAAEEEEEKEEEGRTFNEPKLEEVRFEPASGCSNRLAGRVCERG